jgi:vacuolar protein sorting-associated protein 13A/C
VHKDDWKKDDFQIASNRIYIKKYEASKLELEISLINRVSLQQEEEESDILKTISSLGLLISNFDEAPININAIEAENIFGDQTDVINQIKKYHTEKLLSNVLKFIGASNLLGNPVSFLNSLGTGIREFSDQTSQGEIIRGASSLVQNTLAGTMNSASKITSSFSKGLLVLSDDKEYIYQRDVDTIKNKPKNLIQGINLGLRSAFHSVGSGIAGVVQKPIEETKKDGFYGFLKGTVKGVTGLVVKPVSGALDLISLTSEGIKNTTKTDYELLSDKRLRLPRPFYEIERTIREYDDFHAFWLNLVPRLQPSISPDLFYEASLLESHDDSLTLLFLTHNQIALIHQL